MFCPKISSYLGHTFCLSNYSMSLSWVFIDYCNCVMFVVLGDYNDVHILIILKMNCHQNNQLSPFIGSIIALSQ